MENLEQYLACVNSRSLTDRIISAIDDASVNPLIQTACRSSREDLENYRKDLTDNIERYQQAHGIELRSNDAELASLTLMNNYKYCVIINTDGGKFNEIFNPHLKVGTWSSFIFPELASDQSEMSSAVEVVEERGKVYVFLEQESAVRTIIEYYIKNKT